MHATKCELILRHGVKCMLCGEEKELKEIQWHHLKPRYASKREGFLADDSYENGSLLCRECHKLVHKYDYSDLRYKAYMILIIDSKKPIY